MSSNVSVAHGTKAVVDSTSVTDSDGSSNELYVIYQTLRQQREGLQQLSDTVRRDARDVEIIKNSM